MSLLIDECLSPKLVTAAYNRGFDAYHVAHRGWGGLKDPQLLQKAISEGLILVTNNRDDFLALIRGVELHPGLIVIVENVRRPGQLSYFNAALDVLSDMKSMINKVIEVAEGGVITVYDIPMIR
jgi:predicted nuclease of predicted toxin-antitoxin system